MMRALEEWTPVWNDRTLQLTFHSVWPESTVLQVARDHVRLDVTTLPRFRTEPKLQSFTLRRAHVYRLALDTQHDDGLRIVLTASLGGKTLYIPIRAAAFGSAHELLRVLTLWATDDGVNDTWGTSDGKRRLVPAFDQALYEASRATATPAGMEFPCTAPPDRVSKLGSAIVTVYPVLGLLLWLSYYAPAGIRLEHPAFGVLYFSGSALLLVLWLGLRMRFPRGRGRLKVDHRGLELSDGTRVAFADVNKVVGADGFLSVCTPTGEHEVRAVCGDATVLAAALDALRAAPTETMPEELAQLGRAVQARRTE